MKSLILEHEDQVRKFHIVNAVPLRSLLKNIEEEFGIKISILDYREAELNE